MRGHAGIEKASGIRHRAESGAVLHRLTGNNGLLVYNP